MDDGPHSNIELKSTDVFSVVNNYFLLFFCGSCVMSSIYLQQLFMMMDQYRVGISVSSILGIILPVYLMTRRFGAGFRRQIRLVTPEVQPLVYTVLATIAAVIVVDWIYLISQQFNPVSDEYIKNIADLRPGSPISFAITFLGLCVMVPLAEELVFRGVIQQIFSRNMGPVLGFLLAGLIFGAVHLDAHLLVSISFFGVFLGFIYYAKGNLAYTIIAHSVFNTVALIQLTVTNPAAGEDLPMYLTDARVFVIALVLLVYLLLKLKQGGSETEPPYKNKPDEQSAI